MTQDPYGTRHIRVGHRERDEVAALLQDAAADGRLSMEELDERLDAALRAKTYADLDPLVADLAVAPLAAPQSAPSAFPASGPPLPGYSRDDPLRLDGGVSSETRSGVWTVPPFVRINQGVGSVKLDCLQARPAAPLIEVEIIGGAGSVKIVLPDGWGVNVDRLSKAWGSLKVEVPRDAAPGMPLLVFFGSVGMGSVKVRPATRREWRNAGFDDGPQLDR